jgi:cysteine desulfurase/selenocysteine lyase
MESIDRSQAFSYENELLTYAEKELLQIADLKIYGTSARKPSLVSFNVASIHPFDIGTLLDKQGIAVRTGHHCTQPLMDFYEIPGTVRASFSIYNTKEEVDAFIHALKRALNVLL